MSGFNLVCLITLWCPAAFEDVRKKSLNACGFAWKYLYSYKGYGPGRGVKRRSKSSSMHSKKIFAWGMWVYCQWHHKWRTFRPPWPTLPGPGRQP